MNSELNKSSQSENSKIVLQGESNASADVESKLENDQKDVENLIHDSMDHGAQTSGGSSSQFFFHNLYSGWLLSLKKKMV
jgi:hypothetical protein